MSRARYEFGHVAQVRADTIGEPGQRHFRLLVDSPAGSACLWLEKEQLYGLALAIRQLMTTLEEAPNQPAPPPEATVEAGQPSSVEFKVGNLALGHSAGTELLAILFYDVESEEDGPATLRCWATQAQLQELADEALRVCAAGRPLCPLCHAPTGPERHVCPKANGHSLE